jgi:exodeoxyribonuclease VII large subunit
MTRRLQLSELVTLVQETIEDRFYEDSFWISAEITDVKKYDSKRWCFLKFIEKQGNTITTEMQGVFWANGYQQILLFERITRQSFKDGIEISCRVQVKFHPKYGLKLEVLEIDTSFAVGKMEQERQQILDRLLKENPFHIHLVDGEYITTNKQLKLPSVVQRVALITAPNSDGQRDFRQELLNNHYGYHFEVTEFLTQIQGNNAAALMVEQLRKIYYQAPDFDVVVIVRGGGSQTDLKPFDDYELARQIALFSIPVFTGIGHDRNTSIADQMARQLKTPTKVAAALADINFRFESEIQQLAERLGTLVEDILYDKQNQVERWKDKLEHILTATVDKRKNSLLNLGETLGRTVRFRLEQHVQKIREAKELIQKCPVQMIKNNREKLGTASRILHQLSPETILNRGFAMVTFNERIITDAALLHPGQQVKTIFKTSSFDSNVTEIKTYDLPDI